MGGFSLFVQKVMRLVWEVGSRVGRLGVLVGVEEEGCLVGGEFLLLRGGFFP